MTDVGIVTTDTIPGYLGTMKFMGATISSTGFGRNIDEAIGRATNDLRELAAKHGANHVVGLGLSHANTKRWIFGARVSVIAYGTAVFIDSVPEYPAE